MKLDPGKRYARRIAHAYFVRFHMTLILTAVIASGVLTSKLLLELGLHSLRLRYPLGVLASYLVFLGLVRIWIWYVTLRTAIQVGSLDLNGVPDCLPSGSDTGFAGFGGGDSGGGGASGSWDADAPVTAIAETSSSSSGWFPDLNLDCDLDDGWWILVLLAVLVLAIFGGGIYLVWAAPHILPEAAGQALLAAGISRIAKRPDQSWMAGVVRSTCLPFAIVLVLTGVLGWAAHRQCPGAARLIDVFRCSSIE